MTPAEEAGFIVGKQYVITSGYPEDHDFPIGTTVTFTDDDGSSCPRFDGNNDAGDGYNFPYLRNVGKIPQDSAVVTFEDQQINVPVEITVVTVKRKLTQAERDAIAAIINKGA